MMCLDEPENPTGGARRDRTDDLLLAKQALSQLSYGPGSRSTFLAGLPAEAAERRRLVGLGRFELPTSRLSSARSNQLSYKPVILWTRRAGAQSLRATTCGPRLVHEERET